MINLARRLAHSLSLLTLMTNIEYQVSSQMEVAPRQQGNLYHAEHKTKKVERIGKL